MIEYQVKDKITYKNATLFGYVADLYEKIIDKRMTSSFAVEKILAEAEEPFFTRTDDELAPVGWWRGEFWGKWIISAARACQYRKNNKLESIIRTSVYKLLSTADENGYIGTYKNPELFICPKDIGRKMMGWNCDFCWNIWCQKYTLWGLLEAYDLLGEEKILTAAKKLADQLVEAVRKTGINPCETGTFFGVASGSIMKPILMLYRITEDKKLLDFALSIADGFENEETRCIKIIKKSLLGIPVHVWNHDNPNAIGGKSRFTSQKAYEMMSCFEGICELYRITGIEKYLTATRRFFDLLIEYEFNRLLCVGFNDRFLFASSIEDAVSEPCDIVHYLRLAGDLYRLTGESAYLDFYESAFLNPLLSSVKRDGSWGARAIRSMSHHIEEYNIVDMKYNHCCVNNIPRAFEHASQMTVAVNNDGLWINLYLPSEINIGECNVKISDGYMKHCRTDVTLLLKESTTVYFRIPKWSKKTSVCHNQATHEPMCGDYFPLQLESGEHTVTIHFDHTPRIQNGNYLRECFPLTPYLKQRYDLIMPAQNTEENKATLCIGPMLLAMTTQLGTTWETMTTRKSINGICKRCTATPIDTPDMMCAYNITLETEDGTEMIPMCDYASASNRFTPEDFSIFI